MHGLLESQAQDNSRFYCLSEALVQRRKCVSAQRGGQAVREGLTQLTRDKCVL